jgi:hypothetical protein
MVLIIPDEQCWTMLGADPAMTGIQPTSNPERAAVVLAPEEIPRALAAAVTACRELLPNRVRVEYRELPLPGGTSVRQLLEATEPPAVDHAAPEHAHGEHHHADQSHADHGEHGHREHGRHEHGGHEHAGHEHGGHEHAGHEHGHGGHHDMMAIVGEPSADGLVMESIDFTYGPLGTPFTGGLAVDVTLDGDVVAESAVRALLRAEPSDSSADFPDALSPVAWTVALADSAGTEWLGLAAVELERAISHSAWLRSLGRLLDSHPLTDACTHALASLQQSREILPPGRAAHEAWLRAAFGSPDLAAGREALEEIVTLVRRSRALRWRLRGRAVVSRAEASELGLVGPVGRASGRATDSRSTDARYSALGFDPIVRSEGDALARVVVRAEEALAAVRLADAALQADSGPRSADRVVEGPRGPLHAHRAAGRWELAAPGAEAARRAAASAMIGLEWSAALVALASFDVSPWSIES